MHLQFGQELHQINHWKSWQKMFGHPYVDIWHGSPINDPGQPIWPKIDWAWELTIVQICLLQTWEDSFIRMSIALKHTDTFWVWIGNGIPPSSQQIIRECVIQWTHNEHTQPLDGHVIVPVSCFEFVFSVLGRNLCHLVELHGSSFSCINCADAKFFIYFKGRSGYSWRIGIFELIGTGPESVEQDLS